MQMTGTVNKKDFMIILILGVLLIAIGEPFQQTNLISIGVTLIYLPCIFYVFLNLYEWATQHAKINFPFLLLVISASFSFVMAQEYTYEALVPMICFLEFPILISTFSYNKQQVKRLIYTAFLLLSFLFIGLRFSSLAFLYRGDYGDIIHDALTLGYANPNQTAIYLSFAVFILVSATADTRKPFNKLLLSLLVCFLVFMIFETRSRTAIVAISLFLLVLLFKKTSSANRFLSKYALYIPLVFALILTFNKRLNLDFVFLGDAFDTGRRQIYQDALTSLNTIPKILFGNYLEYRSHNLHNVFVSVLVEYGAFSLIAFLLLLKNSIAKTLRLGPKQFFRPAFLSFLFMLVFSSTEASFFIAGSFFAVSAFCLYYLCLPDINEGETIYESPSDQHRL